MMYRHSVSPFVLCATVLPMFTTVLCAQEAPATDTLNIAGEAEAGGAQDAPIAMDAALPADGPPAGHYQCMYWRYMWTDGSMEMQSSNMGWIKLGAGGTYETGLNASETAERSELNRTGRFVYDAETARFAWKEGWLDGKAASYEEDDGNHVVVFSKEENAGPDGDPFIDTADTRCVWQHE